MYTEEVLTEPEGWDQLHGEKEARLLELSCRESSPKTGGPQGTEAASSEQLFKNAKARVQDSRRAEGFRHLDVKGRAKTLGEMASR